MKDMLQDKIAIITDAANGVGKTTTTLFADTVAKVVPAGIDGAGLARTNAAISTPREIVNCDVTELADMQHAGDAAVAVRRTRIAILNAGDNIRVNTVNPCPVETRMMRSLEQRHESGRQRKHKAGADRGHSAQTLC